MDTPPTKLEWPNADGEYPTLLNTIIADHDVLQSTTLRLDNGDDDTPRLVMFENGKTDFLFRQTKQACLHVSPNVLHMMDTVIGVSRFSRYPITKR